MLILLDAIISLTLRIADIVSAIFDIEVACQPSQRQKHIARTEGQSRLDAPSQPFSAMITDGSDSCITIKFICIRCRMPHTLCVLDFGKLHLIITKWRDAESRLAMQHQARSTTLAHQEDFPASLGQFFDSRPQFRLPERTFLRLIIRDCAAQVRRRNLRIYRRLAAQTVDSGIAHRGI